MLSSQDYYLALLLERQEEQRLLKLLSFVLGGPWLATSPEATSVVRPLTRSPSPERPDLLLGLERVCLPVDDYRAPQWPSKEPAEVRARPP